MRKKRVKKSSKKKNLFLFFFVFFYFTYKCNQINFFYICKFNQCIFIEYWKFLKNFLHSLREKKMILTYKMTLQSC